MKSCKLISQLFKNLSIPPISKYELLNYALVLKHILDVFLSELPAVWVTPLWPSVGFDVYSDDFTLQQSE